jgi:hypothetical protein
VIDRIVIDPAQRASLRFPGFTATFVTVSEALDRWRKLEPADREHAVLVVEGSVAHKTRIEFGRRG